MKCNEVRRKWLHKRGKYIREYPKMLEHFANCDECMEWVLTNKKAQDLFFAFGKVVVNEVKKREFQEKVVFT